MSNKIVLYAIKYSPPCQAVLLTAKELNIELNFKEVDLSNGQHFSEEYLKINPAHTVPSIDDNGFILYESRAIMRYLCNAYGADSTLYPKDAKQRALVDQSLDFDNVLFSVIRDAIARPMFGYPPNEEKMNSLKDYLKILDQTIGDKKYLVSDTFTIADISLLATTHILLKLGPDFTDYPHLKRWLTELIGELPFYSEICDIETEDMMAFAKRVREFLIKVNVLAH